MDQIDNEDLLWKPSTDVKKDANLTNYMIWLENHLDLQFDDYAELWRWSVEHLEDFWRSIWDYFSIVASRQPESILSNHKMPGASWFKGARLNYAENFFSRKQADQPALVYSDEAGASVEVSWQEIEGKTRALAAAMRSFGVGPGDRVVAFMPHIPETIIALFAAASIGAIWSSCSPDFGSRSVLDRFQQIEPKLLIAVDGYQYGGKFYDRRHILEELQSGLPTLKKTIIVPQLSEGPATSQPVVGLLWNDLLHK